MEKTFTHFANATARAADRPLTFALCCLVINLWAATGPLFGFADTWQLVVNTSTTIITFLMVFLIQNTQNRDGAAIKRSSTNSCALSPTRATISSASSI